MVIDWVVLVGALVAMLGTNIGLAVWAVRGVWLRSEDGDWERRTCSS